MKSIPPLNLEIERVYAQLQATAVRSIAITSANAGEGVTSLALALAQRSLLAGNSTLIVDLNLYHPSLKGMLEIDESNNQTLLNSPQLIGSESQEIVVTGITVPTQREVTMKLRQTGVLEQCIAELCNQYDCVIFDTTPINRINANNIPAERVAAACDGTLLTVLAGSTTESMVSNAIKKLNAAGGQLLGCVINDRDNPLLKDELLRETKRLPRALHRVGHWLKKQIRDNRLLSLERY